MALLKVNTGIGTTNPTSALHVIGDGKFTGVVTASSFSGNASSATYATSSGIATYATSAGISTYATSSGIATYATSAGIATYATSAGIATNLKGGSGGTLVYQSAVDTTAFLANGSLGQILQSNGGTSAPSWVNAAPAGAITGLTIRDEGTIVGSANSVSALNFVGNIVSVASTAGIATITFLDYVSNAGVATYATSSGIATYATSAGIATYATSAGIATYASTAGVATYATNSGISTSVIGGIASVTQLSVSGVSTFNGITTHTTSLFGTQASFTGVVTSLSFSGNASSATYATSAGIATYASTAGVATALQNSRTFEITGDIVASPISFDGTGNVSLAATIQPNSVALGSDTTGDYVQSISGTSNQITVTSGTGESSTPTLSIPNQFTAPQDVTVTRDLQVNRNLNVTGNITIGGTSATIFSQSLNVFDPDIILGYRTDAFGNDVSNDNTANHGGVAVASTEGNPLVQLFIAGIETNPATYKKIMWFKAGEFAGLGTDAWLMNYAVGIGSTQFPTGTRLAAGAVQITESDLAVVRHINASGIVTAISFSGNASSATYATSAGIATYADTAGIATYATSSGIATYATVAGIATYATSAGIATYATSSGIATYATSAGIATYATTAGIATYATSSGIATYATSAGVATALQNSRTFEITGDIIASPISFNGTGNVSLAATIQPNSVALGSDTTGNYVTSITNGSYITGGDGGSEGSLLTIGVAATSTNTSNQVVVRDASGNFSAGTITANLTGNASSATYATSSGIATYATSAGISTYATSSGIATYATSAGIATYATTAGISTYATSSGIATNLKGGSGGTLVYQSGTDTTAFLANGSSGQILQSNGGTSAPSWVNAAPAGAITGLTIRDEGTIVGGANSVSQLNFVGNIVSVASTAGIATVTFLDYVSNAGVATYATSSGIATYASTSGVSTSVSGGTGSLTQLQVTGISTFSDGPVFIGAATSTGTANQRLQVVGGASFTGTNNNIGIGTTNPQYIFTVTDTGTPATSGLTNCLADFTTTANSYGQINLRNTSTGTNASSDIVITADNGSDTTNFIDLGINNSGYSVGSWTINGANDGYLYTSDGNLSIGAINASVPKYISFFTGGTLISNERMRVNATGVGIGTTNPQATLQVGTGITMYGATGIISATSYRGDGSQLTGISAGLTVSDDTSTNATRYILFDDVTSGSISAINVSSTKLTFNPSTGNLQVGTGITMYGDTGIISATSYRGDGSQLTGVSGGLTVTDDTSTNSTRYILFDDVTSGSISAINVSSTKLQFNPSTGTLSATVFTSLSDENKKINIQPIENAVEITKQLEGVRFNWIDNNQPSLGLIAQQVEQVIPEVVNENDDGTKSVNYGSLIGLLVEAIKEQQVRIEELENRLNA